MGIYSQFTGSAVADNRYICLQLFSFNSISNLSAISRFELYCEEVRFLHLVSNWYALEILFGASIYVLGIIGIFDFDHCL